MEIYCEVYCLQCYGEGYLDDEIESPCPLCDGTGMVPEESRDGFNEKPITTLNWGTNDGRMVAMESGSEDYYVEDCCDDE